MGLHRLGLYRGPCLLPPVRPEPVVRPARSLSCLSMSVNQRPQDTNAPRRCPLFFRRLRKFFQSPTKPANPPRTGIREKSACLYRHLRANLRR